MLKKMKIHKLIVMFFGIAVALILCEIIMRAYNFSKASSSTLILRYEKEFLYEHKPSITFTNKYGIKVRHNSLGFIGKEIGDKKENTFRVLAIGDSITSATYLPEEERYINRLGQILRGHAAGPVEIINGGVGGYNTWQELGALKEKGLGLKPNLVIVGICLNDYVYKGPKLKKSWLNRITEELRDGSKARYFDFIYQHSDLYKFFYDIFSGRLRGRLTEKDYLGYLKEYELNIKEADLDKWKEPFAQMMLLVKERGTKILFVIFPMEPDVVKKKDVSCAGLSNFFKERGAYYLDLATDFRRHAAQGEALFMRRDLIHPTALGHKIAAEAIADYIIRNKILGF